MEPNRSHDGNRHDGGPWRSIGRALGAFRAPWGGLVGPLLFAPLLLTAFVAPVPGAPGLDGEAPAAEPAVEDVAAARPPTVRGLEERVHDLGAGLDAMEGYYEARVAPIERVLLRFSEDRTLVSRIALALVREGDATGIDPRVLVSVLLVENPWLDPKARSFVGAEGLMQVMPFHAGEWGCASADLSDLDANICHGARIFARYYEQTDGDVDRALLRYNGCVRGTNTPDCHTYPYHVYARAGEAIVHGLLGERGS